MVRYGNMIFNLTIATVSNAKLAADIKTYRGALVVTLFPCLFETSCHNIVAMQFCTQYYGP